MSKVIAQKRSDKLRDSRILIVSFPSDSRYVRRDEQLTIRQGRVGRKSGFCELLEEILQVVQTQFTSLQIIAY
jgi:hypothetical protein